MKITGDVRIAEWVCRNAGGFYTKSPDTVATEDSHSVAVSTNRIVQDFAELLSSIATAAMDDSIDSKEAGDIRNRWEHLKSVTETFVCCCEHGNFDEVKANFDKKTA